jgi:hypothetical protein
MKPKYLNYNAVLEDQQGKTMGPDTRGNYYLVVEQVVDHNDNTTVLGLIATGGNVSE